MPSCRTTTAQCLWLTLLAAFVLYVTDGISFKRVESRTIYSEQEIKAFALEPVNHDGPSTGIQDRSVRLAGRVDKRTPDAGPPLACDKAGHGAHIRGPPAGRHAPA
jgi:hypothetical protein